MSNLYNNSIFWIDVDKIKPNPYQPRREFEEHKLRDLADSIRQYGVLQPLVVSRVEVEKEEGGLLTEYELIAGERRLRASRLAGLEQVPAIIRVGDDSMMKLELAIIENLQREDLNPVDRARAFLRLTDEFKFTHAQIGQKMGKSREYVSNTLRLLILPEEILQALSEGKISEGHTRPIMMLTDRPEEQMTLFKEILFKKITVREAERIARKIAYDKVRKKEYMVDPEIMELEEKLKESLGTRVHIEKKEVGGHITIDFFSNDDLRTIFDLLKNNEHKSGSEMLNRYIEQNPAAVPVVPAMPATEIPQVITTVTTTVEEAVANEIGDTILPPAEEGIEVIDDRSKVEQKTEEDTDLYNIRNFSL